MCLCYIHLYNVCPSHQSKEWYKQMAHARAAYIFFFFCAICPSAIGKYSMAKRIQETVQSHQFPTVLGWLRRTTIEKTSSGGWVSDLFDFWMGIFPFTRIPKSPKIIGVRTKNDNVWRFLWGTHMEFFQMEWLSVNKLSCSHYHVC